MKRQQEILELSIWLAMGLVTAMFILVMAGCTPSTAASIEPTLIRGRIPSKDDFKSITWIGGCTGTLIGPRVVATAAHCVSTNLSISIGKDKYKAVCMVSKEFSKSISADYALCALDGDADGPYEVVNFEEDHVKLNEEILLSGYGCEVWGGRIDGKFRIGEAKISSMGNSSGYLVASDGATLCSGDSGGPAWSLKADGSRNKFIGINSRSDTKKVSFISYIAKAEGVRFFKSWSDKNPGLKICGLHADAENCLGIVSSPKPPIEEKPDFEIVHEIATVKVSMKSAFTGLKAKLQRFLWESLEAIKP